MADVKIVDIDGEQWNIKDQESRKKIATIEENIATQNVQGVQITMNDGYTCKSIQILSHYKTGKIHFVFIRIENLSGDGLGGTKTLDIASTNLIPKGSTAFIARDYKKPTTVRFTLSQAGTLSLAESNGISNGNNVLLGELIFAEP